MQRYTRSWLSLALLFILSLLAQPVHSEVLREVDLARESADLLIFGASAVDAMQSVATGDFNGDGEEGTSEAAKAEPPPVIWAVPGERELLPLQEVSSEDDTEDSWVGMTESEITDLLGPPMRIIDEFAKGDRRLIWGKISTSYRPINAQATNTDFASTSTSGVTPVGVDEHLSGETTPVVVPRSVSDAASTETYRRNCSARVSSAGVVVSMRNRHRCILSERHPVAIARVQGNYACAADSSVKITLVGDYSTIGPDDKVSGSLSYEWTSSSGGFNEKKVLGTASRLILELSPGKHEITLQVADSAGRTDTSALELTIPKHCDEEISVAE